MSLLTYNTIKKFNTSGPRYTSYPSSPNWHDISSLENYTHALSQVNKKKEALSIYIHIPFCEKMCLYCGCSVTIRKTSPQVGDQYLEHLFKEIDLFCAQLNYTPIIKQVHLGGGTPNYLTPEQNSQLIQKLHSVFTIDPQAELSIELDPRLIDPPYIYHLRKLGYNRVSIGIQDFDPKVQKAVNRIQTYETIQPLVNTIKNAEFHSLNMDLIYGLPYQNTNSFHDTIKKVIDLNPDRIALYSFAYVPWLKSHQKLLKPSDFPSDDEKIHLFLNAKKSLNEAHYISIAMDHFAKKEDPLAQAFIQNKLYRNFMGYTLMPTANFIGFGTTSISFIHHHYFQNTKVLKQYYTELSQNQIPIKKEKCLSKDDQIRQYLISTLMCQFHVNFDEINKKFNISSEKYFSEESQHINYCILNNLIEKKNNHIHVTELGKLFIRNICMGFDAYLKTPKATQRFSKTI